MRDLQIIQLSDALELTGVREVPGLLPRTLELTGVDFRTAVAVYINEYSSPSFVVASVNRILAQVPDQAIDQPIRGVSVLSTDFTATIRSQVKFVIGNSPKTASGLLSMMQMYLKILFTTPGVDAFCKNVGGGALQAAGASVDAWQENRLVSDLAVSISRAADHMKSLQRKQTSLNENERLAAANLLSVKFEPATTSLLARIELIAQSGLRAVTNVEL